MTTEGLLGGETLEPSTRAVSKPKRTINRGAGWLTPEKLLRSIYGVIRELRVPTVDTPKELKHIITAQYASRETRVDREAQTAHVTGTTTRIPQIKSPKSHTKMHSTSLMCLCQSYCSHWHLVPVQGLPCMPSHLCRHSGAAKTASTH